MRRSPRKTPGPWTLSEIAQEPKSTGFVVGMAKPFPQARGQYLNILARAPNLKWKHPEGEPEGVREALLHKHEDGSYTHVLRIAAGTEFREPVSHEFFEEAYYVQGEMLNTNTKTTIKTGSYVFHEPHEEHGPFRCLKTCLILEFRYYK